LLGLIGLVSIAAAPQAAKPTAGLPGTWVVRVTLPSQGFEARAIVTFTSDGGLVERFTGSPEGNVGVWEAADRDQFRFMAYRYHVVGTTFQYNDRLRATCQLTGQSTFQCTATADRLDINDNVLPNTTVAGFRLNGTRLTVVRE
jgi:hypothetical protein